MRRHTPGHWWLKVHSEKHKGWYGPFGTMREAESKAIRLAIPRREFSMYKLTEDPRK
jgi:hypothetical protein